MRELPYVIAARYDLVLSLLLGGLSLAPNRLVLNNTSGLRELPDNHETFISWELS